MSDYLELKSKVTALIEITHKLVTIIADLRANPGGNQNFAEVTGPVDNAIAEANTAAIPVNLGTTGTPGYPGTTGQQQINPATGRPWVAGEPGYPGNTGVSGQPLTGAIDPATGKAYTLSQVNQVNPVNPATGNPWQPSDVNYPNYLRR
jgi:hypothetical protein